MKLFSALASLALLVASVKAEIYVTEPTQSSTCTAGGTCTVSWVENGQDPLLSSIGQCSVYLYTGTYIQVAYLATVDVSSASSLSYTIDPSVGGNGAYYLVFVSSEIDYAGFSATFSVNGMTGTTPTGGSSSIAPSGTTTGGSSTSAGSSTSGTSPTGTATGSTPSGTSTPSTTAPTGSTSAPGTSSVSGTSISSGSLTTPSVSTSSTPQTTSPSLTTTRAATTTSATASATASNAAGRVTSSTFGSVAALFVLAGALAF